MRRTIGIPVALLLTAGAAQAQIFDFHSGFWLNLHQLLWHEATAKDAAPSASPEWRAAIEYYARNVVQKDPIRGEMAAVNSRLSAAGSATEPPVELDPALTAVLGKVAAAYRREKWPRHDRANREWIAAVEPLLAKYGDAIRKDVARAYQTEWPPGSIRVDVSAYAGPVGAYTTNEPSHITVSSTDPGYQGEAALEMLFHESSHTIDEKVREAFDKELAARRMLFRRRGFAHAVLFYTAGELTRRRLADYQMYGVRNGIFQNGWPGSLPVLEKDWKPYLDGRVDLQAAVRAIVEDYGVPR